MDSKRILACMFFFTFLLEFSSSASINDKIIVSKVDRTIDISSQLARVSLELTLENSGSESIQSFLIGIDSKHASHLAFASASIKGKNEDDDEALEVGKASVSSQKDAFFLEVELASKLASGKSVTVHIDEVFTHILRPFPSSIGQSEKQLVVYEGNHYVYMPYTVKRQTTTVKLASSKVESNTKLKPTSVSDSVITYGPYSNVKPFSTDAMKIHYENNSPFVAVTEMVRTVEVSHWGNVAVEESFTIKHVGALLKGTFSRYDYQRTPTYAAVKSLKVALPAAAKDVYYRDVIGNISTSNMLVQEDSVELELRPRFPLFGGWKTQYYIGYNVPSYEYLYSQGEKFALKMRFIDHVFDDFVVEKLTVKVILPEGVKDINVKTPFDIQNDGIGVHYTYLDTIGRPVVVLKKDNVVDNHIQDMEIHYSFQKLLLLQEPLLVVGAFYLFFLLVIIIVRMDFSITKDAAKESRMKVAGLLEELISFLEKRTNFASLYDAEIDKFKSSRDTTSFNTALKKINAEYSAANAKVLSHQSDLGKEDRDLADKLLELQKKESERKQLIEQAIVLAQRVVSNKIGKQQYVENNQNNRTRRDRITEDMEDIIGSL